MTSVSSIHRLWELTEALGRQSRYSLAALHLISLLRNPALYTEEEQRSESDEDENNDVEGESATKTFHRSAKRTTALPSSSTSSSSGASAGTVDLSVCTLPPYLRIEELRTRLKATWWLLEHVEHLRNGMDSAGRAESVESVGECLHLARQLLAPLFTTPRLRQATSSLASQGLGSAGGSGLAPAAALSTCAEAPSTLSSNASSSAAIDDTLILGTISPSASASPRGGPKGGGSSASNTSRSRNYVEFPTVTSTTAVGRMNGQTATGPTFSSALAAGERWYQVENDYFFNPTQMAALTLTDEPFALSLPLPAVDLPFLQGQSDCAAGGNVLMSDAPIYYFHSAACGSSHPSSNTARSRNPLPSGGMRLIPFGLLLQSFIALARLLRLQGNFVGALDVLRRAQCRSEEVFAPSQWLQERRRMNKQLSSRVCECRGGREEADHDCIAGVGASDAASEAGTSAYEATPSSSCSAAGTAEWWPRFLRTVWLHEKHCAQLLIASEYCLVYLAILKQLSTFSAELSIRQRRGLESVESSRLRCEKDRQLCLSELMTHSAVCFSVHQWFQCFEGLWWSSSPLSSDSMRSIYMAVHPDAPENRRRRFSSALDTPTNTNTTTTTSTSKRDPEEEKPEHHGEGNCCAFQVRYFMPRHRCGCANACSCWSSSSKAVVIPSGEGLVSAAAAANISNKTTTNIDTNRNTNGSCVTDSRHLPLEAVVVAQLLLPFRGCLDSACYTAWQLAPCGTTPPSARRVTPAVSVQHGVAALDTQWILRQLSFIYGYASVSLLSRPRLGETMLRMMHERPDDHTHGNNNSHSTIHRISGTSIANPLFFSSVPSSSAGTTLRTALRAGKLSYAAQVNQVAQTLLSCMHVGRCGLVSGRGSRNDDATPNPSSSLTVPSSSAGVRTPDGHVDEFTLLYALLAITGMGSVPFLIPHPGLIPSTGYSPTQDVPRVPGPFPSNEKQGLLSMPNLLPPHHHWTSARWRSIVYQYCVFVFTTLTPPLHSMPPPSAELRHTVPVQSSSSPSFSTHGDTAPKMSSGVAPLPHFHPWRTAGTVDFDGALSCYSVLMREVDREMVALSNGETDDDEEDKHALQEDWNTVEATEGRQESEVTTAGPEEKEIPPRKESERLEQCSGFQAVKREREHAMDSLVTTTNKMVKTEDADTESLSRLRSSRSSPLVLLPVRVPSGGRRTGSEGESDAKQTTTATRKVPLGAAAAAALTAEASRVKRVSRLPSLSFLLSLKASAHIRLAAAALRHRHPLECVQCLVEWRHCVQVFPAPLAPLRVYGHLLLAVLGLHMGLADMVMPATALRPNTDGNRYRSAANGDTRGSPAEDAYTSARLIAREGRLSARAALLRRPRHQQPQPLRPSQNGEQMPQDGNTLLFSDTSGSDSMGEDNLSQAEDQEDQVAQLVGLPYYHLLAAETLLLSGEEAFASIASPALMLRVQLLKLFAIYATASTRARLTLKSFLDNGEGGSAFPQKQSQMKRNSQKNDANVSSSPLSWSSSSGADDPPSLPTSLLSHHHQQYRRRSLHARFCSGFVEVEAHADFATQKICEEVLRSKLEALLASLRATEETESMPSGNEDVFVSPSSIQDVISSGSSSVNHAVGSLRDSNRKPVAREAWGPDNRCLVHLLHGLHAMTEDHDPYIARRELEKALQASRAPVRDHGIGYSDAAGAASLLHHTWRFDVERLLHMALSETEERGATGSNVHPPSPSSELTHSHDQNDEQLHMAALEATIASSVAIPSITADDAGMVGLGASPSALDSSANAEGSTFPSQQQEQQQQQKWLLQEEKRFRRWRSRVFQLCGGGNITSRDNGGAVPANHTITNATIRPQPSTPIPFSMLHSIMTFLPGFESYTFS